MAARNFTQIPPHIRTSNSTRRETKFFHCETLGVGRPKTWPIGCDTPSAFSKPFPLGEHVKWRCDTPPPKGYLSDTCAIPSENKANGCDTPLCDTISKGYCAIWGGISHWAAKLLQFSKVFFFFTMLGANLSVRFFFGGA